MAKTINKTAIIGKGALCLFYGQHIADVLGKDSVSFILDDDRYKCYQSKTFTINGEALKNKILTWLLWPYVQNQQKVSKQNLLV